MKCHVLSCSPPEMSCSVMVRRAPFGTLRAGSVGTLRAGSLVTPAPACPALILSSAAPGASRERRVSKDRPEPPAAILRYAPSFAGRRPALLRMRDAGWSNRAVEAAARTGAGPRLPRSGARTGGGRGNAEGVRTPPEMSCFVMRPPFPTLPRERERRFRASVRIPHGRSSIAFRSSPFRSPRRRPARRGGTLFRAYRARLPARVGAGAVRAPDYPRARGRRRTHLSHPFLRGFFAPAQSGPADAASVAPY